MEEGGFYFSAILDERTKLFLAQLTDDEAVAAGREEDCSGYFLYKKCTENPHEISILAHVDSDDAAFVLGRMLNMV